ncbi:hypothetical protein [Janthinobacterium lividum]|uniref:hypothetical protein n=1 Tax=Janthinobacterium lividum TaxID=29581 RepID=UPI000873F4C9|nr:hypothetical protein [Janthinobacterium lividum]MCC7715516.1 hypothetical protein [Janthinobacterium lividum]OEZ52098.1 hypothetical protein JANLI_50190 [Janthinobacterium lividum]WQE29434.1 hypothetical protein U0004_03115 [Janthinobacterium lividum]STQ94914.1 Uncharacterised protein [Janthinobacterium lividum]
MIKKTMAFLFALGLSASYAFAASDVTQCYSECGQKVANCRAHLGGSPICEDLYGHCLSNCQQ